MPCSQSAAFGQVIRDYLKVNISKTFSLRQFVVVIFILKHFFTELGSPLRLLPDYRRRRLVFYLYLRSSLFITWLGIWHAPHAASRRVMSPKLCPASMEMCESERAPRLAMAMAVHQIACHPKRFLFNLSAIESSFKRKQQEKGDQQEEKEQEEDDLESFTLYQYEG